MLLGCLIAPSLRMDQCGDISVSQSVRVGRGRAQAVMFELTANVRCSWQVFEYMFLFCSSFNVSFFSEHIRRITSASIIYLFFICVYNSLHAN